MEEVINRILLEIRPEINFKESEDFLSDGFLDSFDIVMLVTELDKAFQISIEGTEVIPENFQNIESIEKLLQKYGVL